MLQSVDVGERALASYRGTAPEQTLDELATLAAELAGARVLHLNATPYGGGVSELLRSMVPLLNDLGVVADWKVIRGEERFFDITKSIHNGLQGGERPLSGDERELYERTAAENAALLDEDYDFVFVHDPQPAAMLAHRGTGPDRWVWRCHIDTSEPNPGIWAYLREFLAHYDAAVFTMEEFAPPDMPVDRVEIVPPAIDPLSPKNRPLDDASVNEILAWIGIDPGLPLVTQVSRFDPWKDPLGVIEAYRQAREEIDGPVQLALVGSMALDDPEGWKIHDEIMAEAKPDPLIHVFTNLTGVGNTEVNAFQRLSDVVVQKSIREGFGLVVSEALWKGTPVVAGNAGGIPLQMADGAGGELVDGVDECARAIAAMLRDRDHAEELGRRGRERVREHFLLPRLLLNELSLMLDVLRARPLAFREAPEAAERDPVCGMAIERPDEAFSFEHGGREYRFCSHECRERFADDPDRFAATHPGSAAP